MGGTAPNPDASTVAVVGGGVIGLVSALRLAELGWQVTVYDPDSTRPASGVAGGMLAAVGEARVGEDDLLALLRSGARAWDRLLGELDATVLSASGTVLVAVDAADAADLATAMEWAGGAEVLSRPRLRELEPSLTRSLRAAYLVDNERALDNSLTMTALRERCGARGVSFVDAGVTSVAELPQARVLLAAGAWTPTLWPGLPVHPVKGEILRLRRGRYALAPIKHVVRARVNGRVVYIVPRRDGVVIGATSYEAAVDEAAAPRVGGIADLLTDAIAILPGIREYDLVATQSGYRPTSADGLPLIGWLDERVAVATGHGRNGFALAALTGELVATLFAGETIVEQLDPRRAAWASA